MPRVKGVPQQDKKLAEIKVVEPIVEPKVHSAAAIDCTKTEMLNSTAKKTASKKNVKTCPKRVKVTSAPSYREIDAYFETFVVSSGDAVDPDHEAAKEGTKVTSSTNSLPDPFQTLAMISQAIANAGGTSALPSIDFSLLSIPPPLGLKLPTIVQTPKPVPNKNRYFLPEMLPKVTARDRDKEMITCSVCEKEMRRGSLREHMDRHENNGKFQCPQCNKTFSRASAREKHIRTHTGERPYACDQCDKSYRQKVHLNEHMRSHSGERPFVCRLCGFSLTSKSLLNRHLRTHGVEGKRAANEAPELWLRTDASTERVLAAAAQVGASFLESAGSSETIVTTALNATATVEACGRKHLCTECPAGFPTIQALRSHRVTTHGLLMPHTCKLCPSSIAKADKTFSSLKTLRAHARKAHPQVCPICNETMPLRRRWVLEVHLRERHAGVSAESVIGPSPLSVGRVRKTRNTLPASVSNKPPAKEKKKSFPTELEPRSPGRSLRKKVRFEAKELVLAIKKDPDEEKSMNDDKEAEVNEKTEDTKDDADLLRQLQFHPVNENYEFLPSFISTEDNSNDSEGSIIKELRSDPMKLIVKTEPFESIMTGENDEKNI